MSDAVMIGNFDDEMPPLRTEIVEFVLGGETFHCVPEAPGGVVSALVSSISFDDRGRQMYHLPNMQRFIEDVLLEEMDVEQPPTPQPEGDPLPAPVMVTEPCDDLARWKALMVDKKRPMPISLLAKVVLGLQNYYTAERPTERSKR